MSDEFTVDELGLTRADAARALGINKQKLDALIESGELIVIQAGHYRRIPHYSMRDYQAREFALRLVYNCVRNNTSLENLHAGRLYRISERPDDLSDVKVVGPLGEIPWAQVSRLTQDEMKQLMKEIVNNVFTVLALPPDKLYRMETPREWDRPEWAPGLIRDSVEMALQEREYEEIGDPRSTEDIRAMYEVTKSANSDDARIVELCDAGMALLDAEVALAKARTRPAREIAFVRLRERQVRMDAAAAVLQEAGDADAVEVLGEFAPTGKAN